MVTVTENYPGALPVYNQKIDVQVVPVGDEDKWVDAGDVNDITDPLVSLARAVRFNALVASLTDVNETFNGKACRFTGVITNGLAVATAVLTSDLDKLFAACIETIEQGGDLDGTASNTGFFGVYNGILSAASGVFVTNTLYGLSSDGSLITHVSGALPPVARGLSATTAYVDMGGRIRADTTTIKFNSVGELEVLGTAGEYDDGGEAQGKDRILGNTDNFDLSFITNNIVRLHLQNDGKIAIGPAFTAPTSDAHLRNDQDGPTQITVENQDVGPDARSAIVLAEDSAGTTFGSAHYSNSGASGAFWTRIPNSTVWFTGAGATGGLIIGTLGATAPVRFFVGGSTNDKEEMRVDPGQVSVLKDINIVCNENVVMCNDNKVVLN